LSKADDIEEKKRDSSKNIQQEDGSLREQINGIIDSGSYLQDMKRKTRTILFQ
jgi:hypothetical protein